MLDKKHMASDEELDEMVLMARALEGHMILYTDAQRDRMMKVLRGLLAYEASRPAWHRPAANVIEFETALIRSRLMKTVSRERRSAIADARKTLQHGVNEFGDLIFDDLE
ncbi:hypothetical protein [Agrobacterium tumefaciens]|uniref:hypothetical protein n=1 Tax=Agrobacterium tumefaciens TaxID=358 RepID=UPI003B9EF3F5